jgi:rhodanese-related sulfurtransferase
MKKYLFVACVLWACTGEAQKVVLSPSEFQSKLKDTPDAILLDVRRPEEIAVERLENSRSIVFDDSFETKLDDLEQKPLFVYCASGKRSAKAAAILRGKGYKNVYELEGGLGAWFNSGPDAAIKSFSFQAKDE